MCIKLSQYNRCKASEVKLQKLCHKSWSSMPEAMICIVKALKWLPAAKWVVIKLGLGSSETQSLYYSVVETIWGLSVSAQLLERVGSESKREAHNQTRNPLHKVREIQRNALETIHIHNTAPVLQLFILFVWSRLNLIPWMLPWLFIYTHIILYHIFLLFSC